MQREIENRVRTALVKVKLSNIGASTGASSITTLALGSIIINGILEQHFGVAYL
jgi:hypothetical protein